MNAAPTLYFANDHGGVTLKQALMAWAEEQGISSVNLGVNATTATDYPDLAHTLATKMQNDDNAVGILICRTGIGMSMAVNRHQHIRAAVCTNAKMAHHTRQDNDANVLCLGADLTTQTDAIAILKMFLETSFLGHAPDGARHARRVQKISPNNDFLEGRRAGKHYV